MYSQRRIRNRNLPQNAWRDSGDIANVIRTEGYRKSRILLFFDMINMFKKYYLLTYQYKKNRMWELEDNEKYILASQIGDKNKVLDNYITERFRNREFLNEYMQYKYELSPKLIKKRIHAYTIKYGFGRDCKIQYGVSLTCEHRSIGKLEIGNFVHFARDIDIDYTGGLKLGDDISISEGTKILTHNHDYLNSIKDKSKLFDGNAYATPLIIEDGVWIGARVMINPGVGVIGRKAVLAVGAVVKKKVPPYAIVMGNPAKIVGFSMRPDEAFEYECSHYPEGERIPLSVLEKNYQKYLVDRAEEITKYTNL